MRANASPIPRKKPVHFKLGLAWSAKSVSSRSVQAYTPADHSLSWFQLLATQGSCLAAFSAAMRLQLLSIKADEAMIRPQKPVHFNYFQAGTRNSENVTFLGPVQACAPIEHWGSCFRLLACSARRFRMLAVVVRLEMPSSKTNEVMILPQKPVHPATARRKPFQNHDLVEIFEYFHFDFVGTQISPQ